eukprot:TRINITY_DN2649_c0_g1_i2.p1 TRINITY_DN2649_c0_g1~~TRINITY_DN2649_c0_g1_i2.p1  ORF type:complete len:325 (+),score=52.45 TRINITY_DN2649_c0_g1_i2:496-1470(+)
MKTSLFYSSDFFDKLVAKSDIDVKEFSDCNTCNSCLRVDQELISQKFTTEMVSSKFDLSFLHVSSLAYCAKEHGIDSPEYRTSVMLLDSMLFSINETMKDAGIDDYTLVLAGNHGRDSDGGFSHRSFELSTIQTLLMFYSPTSSLRQNFVIPSPLATIDIVPTILWSLGIPSPQQFRGRIIWDIFLEREEKETKSLEENTDLNMYQFCQSVITNATKNTWIFNRTGATESISGYGDDGDNSENIAQCSAPEKPDRKVAELGWDIFSKTVTPFLFLVVGYALGLGVKTVTIFNARGGCTDSRMIEGLAQVEASSTSSESEETIAL